MMRTRDEWFGARRWMGLCLMGMALGLMANAQAVSTTTVQGTVYLANGQVGAGTLNVSWPSFATAGGQAIAAGQMMVTIAPDGFVSVNLAPNQGATPAGLYYTVVYQMSDGTTSTQYWVVPAVAQATLAQVQAQLMPAAQAVQTVSKAYVDQSIAEMAASELSLTGGTLSGPLLLNSDPTQALQAADKHYVDSTLGQAVPQSGGSMTGALTDSSGFIGPLTGNVTGNVSGSSSSVTGVVQPGNGGTGASTAAGALANLGGAALAGSTFTGAVNAPAINGAFNVASYANTQTAVTSNSAAGVTPFWIPATYTTSDPEICQIEGAFSVVTGYGCSWMVPSNAQIQDYRYGDYQTGVNIVGDQPTSNANSWHNWRAVYSTSTGVGGLHQINFNPSALYLGGGVNINENGYTNIPWQSLEEQHLYSYTPGNAFGVVQRLNKYSNGDMLSLYPIQTCYGGRSAGSAEGCEGINMQANQGTVEYTATASSTTSWSSSTTTVPLTPTAGDGTQGAGRFLVDITKAYSTGTINSITNGNGTVPTTVTFTGSGFPVSTVNTTLGTAFTAPGTFTCTPASMTNISAGTVLTISDGRAFEHVAVTSTTGSTFTATFRYPHPATAIVAAGGMSGYYFDPAIDDATPALYGVTNTLHYVIPVIRSTSATSIDIALEMPNLGYQGYNGQWASGRTSIYNLYPGAEVVSVQSPVNAQQLSSTLTLEPYAFAWTAGDVAAQPHYYDIFANVGIQAATNYFPLLNGGNPSFGEWWSFSGAYGTNTAFVFSNNTPSAVTANIGSPNLFYPQYSWGTWFKSATAPTTAAIWMNQSTTNWSLLNQALPSGEGSALIEIEPTTCMAQWQAVSGTGTGSMTFNFCNGTLATNGQFSGPGTGLTGTAASLNIGGTAAGLSGTPALPNGTTATTQNAGDNSAKIATTAYVYTAVGAATAPTFKLPSPPIANTGSTTKNYVGTITIPAGTMGTASQLHLQVRVGACTATSGVPTSVCTGTANTGTCSPYAYFSNTSGSGGVTSSIINGGYFQAAKPGVVDAMIANTSATTQVIDSSFLGTFAGSGGPSFSGTVNTANATYINLFMQNAVSGDECFIDSAFAQLIP
jgi:hypothetical protein